MLFSQSSCFFPVPVSRFILFKSILTYDVTIIFSFNSALIFESSYFFLQVSRVCHWRVVGNGIIKILFDVVIFHVVVHGPLYRFILTATLYLHLYLNINAIVFNWKTSFKLQTISYF